jgi:hypothetical protein
MIVAITLIKLKSPLHYFQLVFHYLKIMKQAKNQNCLLLKSTGLWTDYYTLTNWKSMDELKKFVRSENHLQAIKKSSTIAKEILTISFETNSAISWREAKKLVTEKGKLISY